MERGEVEKILEESLIKFDSPFSKVACRGRIARAIAEKKIKPTLSGADWNIFLETLEAEYFFSVANFLAVNESSNKMATVELVEKLKILFGKWQRLLEFMMDNYDKLPSRIRQVANKDTFVLSAAYVYVAKENLPSKIDNMGVTKFIDDISEPLMTFLAQVRMFLLDNKGSGDEKYREFVIEVRDAFAVAKALRHEKKP